MLVPRSQQFAPSWPRDIPYEKHDLRSARKTMATRSAKRTGLRPAEPERTTTEPARISSVPKPVHTPTRTASAQTTRSHASPDNKQYSPAHDPKALPPAVAALLAVTQIPPRRPQKARDAQNSTRRISIDQLISEWEQEESFDASYSTSAGLDVLWEDSDDKKDLSVSEPEPGLLSERSASDESLPSLDTDEYSIISSDSLGTPESLQSRRSGSRKATPRSVPITEKCESSHPLIEVHTEDDHSDLDFFRSTPLPTKTKQPKSKSSLTSNLTLSLQSLKNAALSSISSFSFNSNTRDPKQRSPSAPFSDDMLWSHPFLFPRFSQEGRPPIDIECNPTEAERRYLNPTPLTFEEQEAPYQLALHAPYLAAQSRVGVPSIQLQTYHRGKRKSARRGSGGFDPRSEAGRALGVGGVRHRELRENSDFLRVVVMEMNMRRVGKLETGKARLWLPPRQVTVTTQSREKVPRRWIGESAY